MPKMTILVTILFMFIGCQFQSVEKVCFPGTQVCVDGKPNKYKICSLDGMAWETRSCPADSTCDKGQCISDFPGNLRIITTSLPPGANDEPYEFQLEVEGGVEPYAWQLLSGTLPEGRELSSSGRISGIPTTPGESEMRLRVFDGAASPAWTEFSTTLQIDVAPLEVIGDNVYSIMTTKIVVLPFLIPYVPYDALLQSKGGLRPHYWREANPPAMFSQIIPRWGLPDGLTLSMSPGRISGTVQSTADAVGVTLPNGTTITGYFLYLRTTDSQEPPDSVETVFCIPTVPMGN